MKAIDFVVFGGTGDLSMRKLMPALFYLLKAGHFPKNSRILAVSCNEVTQNDFNQHVKNHLQKALPNEDFESDLWQAFKAILRIITLEVSDLQSWNIVQKTLTPSGLRDTIFYLAPPLI